MIDTKKIRIFKAFTLAEVMITMIIVALVTVFSVPVIKKSRTVMDRGVDKHSWGAFYVDDKLVVCEDGTCKDGDEDGDGEVDFTPPAGVSRFNVTVVGGGGGGAAGLSSPENTKKFFADSITQNFMYRVPNDGVYRIVAIGGGGGGAGGAVTCEGNDGESGGAVVLTAKLKKDAEYAVIVGQGGFGGPGKDWGDLAKQLAKPVLIVVGIVGLAIACYFLAPVVIGAVAGAVGGGGAAVGTAAGAAAATTTVYVTLPATSIAVTGVTSAGATVIGAGVTVVKMTATLAALATAAGGAVGAGATIGGLTAVSSMALAGIGAALSTPSGDYTDGGGHGLNTSINGGYNGIVDLNIVARGGSGGKYRVEKFAFYCGDKKKKNEGQFLLNHIPFDPSSVEAADGILIGEPIKVDNNGKNRFMCSRNKKGEFDGDDKNKSICNELDKAIDGGYNEAVTYGDGGKKGSKERSGKPGSGGYAQITEVTAYGGGAGQAGSVSVYTFERSPLNKDEKSVKVKVGKGGDGGKADGDSLRYQNGEDGEFSRFGTKIIAQGGEGGKIRAVGGVSKDQDHYKGIGEDGLSVSLPSALFKNANIDGKFNRDVFKAKEDAAGEGRNTKGLKGTPGIGGAGGSAYSVLKTYEHAAYDGGSGADGLVLVTW